MEFSDWVRQYSVNDPLMDSYHHIFFQGAELIERVAAEGDLESAKERLTFLLVYANMHFDAEESLMAKSHYPGLEGHRAQHVKFRERIQLLQARMRESPNMETVLEMSKLVQGWWMEHILQEDMKYAPHMKK
jgi:hemerythrin